MNLSELLNLGIIASIGGDGGLQLDAPKGALTPELIERIRHHKPSLIAEIRAAREVGELGELHFLCTNPAGEELPLAGDVHRETPTDTAPPVRATRWLLHYADREPMEVWFSPAADHDEALAGYPDAVAAEPVPERTDTRTANVIERDENDQRKEPTTSEKVALAEAIEARIKGPNGTRQGQRTDLGTCGNVSTSDEAGQKTRDIAAAKAGLGSGKTLEAAQKVIERDITVVLPVITKPTSITVATGCKSCRHRKRPGRSDPGYCGGGRDDLLGAYGEHHPLRKLPDDQGESCASYLPHEG